MASIEFTPYYLPVSRGRLRSEHGHAITFVVVVLVVVLVVVVVVSKGGGCIIIFSSSSAGGDESGLAVGVQS